MVPGLLKTTLIKVIRVNQQVLVFFEAASTNYKEKQMVYSVQIPDNEREQFKRMLSEAKNISGLPLYRILISAVKDYLVKLKKGQF